ncbi:MAG: phenylalanine--tRNA ligase subunit alpha [Sphingomonadales bacterium]
MSDISQEITALEDGLKTNIDEAPDIVVLENIRVKALGKKGSITNLMKGLGKMTPEERQKFGPLMNGIKNSITGLINKQKRILEQRDLEVKLQSERLDMTLPIEEIVEGRIHPVSQVMDELSEIFACLGFSVAEGPDIEDDFHNFTALNIPPEHPARQMHDTFYLPENENGERKVLRTHTSPVQIRTMMEQGPPLRIIAPGRTYRSDSDATHTPMFHQVEGLVIDKDVHMGHLKGTLEAFIKAFFEVDKVEMRFRPSYFPFTEPSAEVDIRCTSKKGVLRIGEGDDWLEILGCGMVNPKVLEYCKLDPNKYQGFAWGCGVDRLAMLKYGMTDLRPFFEGDLRWQKHYGFLPLEVPTIAGGLSR